MFVMLDRDGWDDDSFGGCGITFRPITSDELAGTEVIGRNVMRWVELGTRV